MTTDDDAADPDSDAAPPRAPEGDWLGTPYLRFERRGPIAVCTVDRPDKRNAMTPAMYFGVRYAVDHVNRQDELVGLLITGRRRRVHPRRRPQRRQHRRLGRPAHPAGHGQHALRRHPQLAKPVVCAVNGIAQGGGLMIAMLADVTVAADTATFRAPELLRGIADTNYGQILPRQVGPARARDMLLTGRTVTAAEALAWGLVARVVAPDQLMAEATAALMAAAADRPRRPGRRSSG